MTDTDIRKRYHPAGAAAPVSKKTFFDVAFDGAKADPSWTVHRLTQGRTIKKFNRDGTPIDSKLLALPFKRDTALDSISPEVYAGSGYDTGHMVPCEAMQFDLTALRESFLTSNVCPQRPGLNRGPWRTLESRCFEAAKAGRDLVIISGPIFLQEGHTLCDNGPSIPDAFFKVVVSPDERAISCYVMPNAEHVETSLEAHYAPLSKVGHLAKLGFPEIASYRETPSLLDPRPQLLKLDLGNPVCVEDLENGEYVLLRDLLCDPCDAKFPNARVKLKAGFVSDFGSIPEVFTNLYPRIGTFRDRSFLLHDGLYASNYFEWDQAYKTITDTNACRAECDWRLLESLQAAGDSWTARNTIWSAVKIGGGSVWKQHTPESIAAARTLIETVEAVDA